MACPLCDCRAPQDEQLLGGLKVTPLNGLGRSDNSNDAGVHCGGGHAWAQARAWARARLHHSGHAARAPRRPDAQWLSSLSRLGGVWTRKRGIQTSSDHDTHCRCSGGTICPSVYGAGHCLQAPAGGGGVSWGPAQRRLTPPPTHAHQKFFLRGEMKFIKGARNGRAISETQTCLWPLTPHPTHPPVRLHI